jgi:hypothetical protein
VKETAVVEMAVKETVKWWNDEREPRRECLVLGFSVFCVSVAFKFVSVFGTGSLIIILLYFIKMALKNI